jgi:hypothetical protein
LSIVALTQYFTRYRPESPQVELGRTFAIDANYGKIVFVTPKEKRIRDLINFSVFLPVAIGATNFVILGFKAASGKNKEN